MPDGTFDCRKHISNNCNNNTTEFLSSTQSDDSATIMTEQSNSNSYDGNRIVPNIHDLADYSTVNIDKCSYVFT